MREISEKEYHEMTDSFSIKSEYEKMSGKGVTPERFLFCCYEVSNHLKEVDVNFKEKNLWPGLKPSDSDQLTEEHLPQNIADLCKWYADSQERLTDKKPVDFDTMWHICVDLAHLEKDFGDLVTKSSGSDIEDHLLDEEALEGVWLTFKQCLLKEFPSIGKKAWGYYLWAYGITPPPREVNLSEVPPVGRYARAIANSRNSGFRNNQNNQNSHSSRGSSDNSRRGPRNSNQPRQGGGPTRNDRNDRPRDNDRNRPNRGGDGARNFSQNKRPPRDKEAEKTKELEVIKLVELAVADTAFASSGDITLKPQNSFFRRIQHKHAVDLGYTTESTGEGKSRAVKIFKK